MIPKIGDPAFISLALVKMTLKEMRDASKPTEPNPLDQMLLVEQRMLERAMPRTSHGRTFALYDVLIGLIESEFAAVRHAHDLPMPESQWQIAQYQDSLARDFITSNAPLVYYSLLYHIFAHPELGIDTQKAADWMSVTVRTAERYLEIAQQRFTYDLIAAERAVRRANHRRMLLNRLPSSKGRYFTGHDALLNRVNAVFAQPHPAHILISGEAGSGKTAFAEVLIRQWIDANQIADVVWIDAPESVAYLRATLSNCLIPEGMRVELRDVLTRAPQPIVIVCDGCERILEFESDALDEFLLEGDSAVYLLTSRRYEALEHIGAAIEIPPLAFSDAFLLMRQIWNDVEGDPLTEEEAEAIYAELGGNPDALITAARRRNVETWGQIRHVIHWRTFGEVWTVVQPPIRCLWIAAAIFGESLRMVLNVTNAFGISQVDECFGQLRRWSAVEPESDQLTVGAQRFIETAVQTDESVKSGIDHILQQVESELGRATAGMYQVIETVLTQSWLTIELQRRISWVLAGAAEGVERGRAALWADWLHRLPVTEHTYETMRLYSVALRRLGRWTEASQILNEVISGSGHKGMFAEQTRAIVELEVIERLSGRFDRALALVEQAGHAVPRYAPEFAPRLALERGRIFLDRGESAQALDALNALTETAEVLLLKCEAYLLSRFYGECRRLAELLFQHDLSDAQRAALHTLIGRSYAGDGDHETAQRYYSSSLAIAERGGDPLAIARAQGNFGAGLYQLCDNESAQTALKYAVGELSRLGDQVGLAAALHNLQLVEIRLAR